MPSNVKEFRKDINGLRAWAVVAVILFHFNVPGFSGGFVGVDIFFVISGYLMTGIIARGLQNNNFSIINFYISRARRILPALIVLCLALLAVAWFYLSPVDLESHTKHTTSALQFTSNFKFLREAGYFDTASHEKLLLHTWSLSVEWQFYLLLPLLVASVWKLRPSLKTLKTTLLVTLFISLSLSFFISSSSPNQAFYSLHTRAWEMIAGGLVYLFANQLPLNPHKQRLLESLGFILIVFSIIFLNEDTTWPGLMALIPVLGSVFILAAAKQSSLWTSTKIMQHIGDWSYSLYLWHWPLAALLVQFNLRGNQQATIICLALTLLLGWLSFRFIENPLRKSLAPKKNWLNLVVLGLGIIFVVLASLQLKKYKNHPNRIPEEVATIFNEASNKLQRKSACKGVICNKNPSLIIMGDSHAQMLINALNKSLQSETEHLLEWTQGGCVTIIGIQKRDRKNYKECSEFNEEKLKENLLIDSKIPLLIVNRTSMYALGEVEQREDAKYKKPRFYINYLYNEYSESHFNDIQTALVATACEFAKTRPVYLLRPVPEFSEHVPNVMGKSLWHTGKISEVSISLDEYHERHKFVWKAQDEAAQNCGVKLLNPLPYLCQDGRCKGDVDGIPIYSDMNHLNDRGASMLIPLLKNIFIENKSSKSDS